MDKAHARETVSFWRENERAVVILLTSPGNVGNLVFLESGEGFATIIQNNCVKFVAHKEYNGASWDEPLLSTLIKKKMKVNLSYSYSYAY